MTAGTMVEVVVTAGARRRAKLQSDCHHQQTNTQFFSTNQMPFLSPSQQCQRAEGKTFMLYRSAHLKLSWGLSLTTRGSWLPWGRAITPLISPLTPVLQSKNDDKCEGLCDCIPPEIVMHDAFNVIL